MHAARFGREFLYQAVGAAEPPPDLAGTPVGALGTALELDSSNRPWQSRQRKRGPYRTRLRRLHPGHSNHRRMPASDVFVDRRFTTSSTATAEPSPVTSWYDRFRLVPCWRRRPFRRELWPSGRVRAYGPELTERLALEQKHGSTPSRVRPLPISPFIARICRHQRHRTASFCIAALLKEQGPATQDVCWCDERPVRHAHRTNQRHHFLSVYQRDYWSSPTGVHNSGRSLIYASELTQGPRFPRKTSSSKELVTMRFLTSPR